MSTSFWRREVSMLLGAAAEAADSSRPRYSVLMFSSRISRVYRSD